MASTSSTSSTTGTNPSQNLRAQANFLQLLVTQMTSQDPLSPQSDTEFAAQLAQFTALQTAQTTQQNVADVQATQLLGATVTIAPGGTAQNIQDLVSKVTMNAGTPYVTLQNYPNAGPFSLSQIVNIEQNAAAGTKAISGQ